jgi:mevalonate pyrophosphate decarboxylase
MYSMPQFVKDWILKHTNSSSSSAAFAAALAAGLTPAMFTDHYERHVGRSASGSAKAAHLETPGAARFTQENWDEGDDEDRAESDPEVAELNRYMGSHLFADSPPATHANAATMFRDTGFTFHT